MKVPYRNITRSQFINGININITAKMNKQKNSLKCD